MEVGDEFFERRDATNHVDLARGVRAVDKAEAGGWMEMTEENKLIFHRLWMLEIFHRRQERYLGH